MTYTKGDNAGASNPRWNGGVRITQGYRTISHPSHPNASKDGYVREHVYMMSQHLGRPIAKNEIVHHINEDRLDNRLENLQVMTRSEHHSLHHRGVIKTGSIAALSKGHTSAEMVSIWRTTRANERTILNCLHCGHGFFRRRIKRPHKYCSLQCYHAHKPKKTRL
jgi:hypothetical protein